MKIDRTLTVVVVAAFFPLRLLCPLYYRHHHVDQMSFVLDFQLLLLDHRLVHVHDPWLRPFPVSLLPREVVFSRGPLPSSALLFLVHWQEDVPVH